MNACNIHWCWKATNGNETVDLSTVNTWAIKFHASEIDKEYTEDEICTSWPFSVIVKTAVRWWIN